MRIRKGDWVRHPKIEQALLVENIDDSTAWLRSPSPEGWVFPVWFALPMRELSKIENPHEPPFEEAPF